MINKLFVAHRKYSASETIVIIANSIEEATERAKEYFGMAGLNMEPIVRQVEKTEIKGVYK